jgi:hypothetical protein
MNSIAAFSSSSKRWLGLAVLAGCALLDSVAHSATILSLQLRAVNASGEHIETFEVGEHFTLQLLAHDLRDPPSGAFSVYADIAYTAERVVLDGDLQYGASFPNGHLDFEMKRGLLDEIGGVAGMTSVPPEAIVVSVPFLPTAPGDVLFTLEPADLVHHEITVMGRDSILAKNDVEFGSLTLTVVPEPTSTSVMAFIVVLAALSLRRRLAHRLSNSGTGLGYCCPGSLPHR